MEELKKELDDIFKTGTKVPELISRKLKEAIEASDAASLTVIFESAIEVLNGDSLINQEAKELVDQLLCRLHSNISGEVLFQVSEYIIKELKKGNADRGRSLELLPVLVEQISTKQSIAVKTGGTALASCKKDGLELKTCIIEALLEYKWAPTQVSHLVTTFKDMILLPHEFLLVIEKLLQTMREVDLQELPPLVYQLLLLSDKGCQKQILHGLLGLFNHLDTNILKEKEPEEMEELGHSKEDLLQAEGTVLLHVDYFIKHSASLADEFMKELKNTVPNQAFLTPFGFAFLLSIAHGQRFSEPVYEFMRAMTIRLFKEQDRMKQWKWMQENQSTLDLEDVILQVVDHSVYGWDYVVEGLFHMAFYFMDSVTPKLSAGYTPLMRTCKLGGRVLIKCFKFHSMVRQEMISQLFNRILSNSSTYVDHYINVLAEAAQIFPQISQAASGEMRNDLAFISSMPHGAVTSLLSALLPLIQFSASLRDNLLMILRKCLFNRKVEVRSGAVCGYLTLLKDFKVLESNQQWETSQSSQFSSSSQVSVEVHSSRSSGTHAMFGNEALCLEILGVLRRCLSQQNEVKVLFYQGLPEVFARNSKLAEPIVEILCSHFEKFHEQDLDLIPPVKLVKCVSVVGERVTQSEPLAHLISSLQQCVTMHSRWVEDGATSLPAVDDAHKLLSAFAQRISQCDLEDFELAEGLDLSPDSISGMTNAIHVRLVMGLYEAMLEYTFSTGKFSERACQLTLQLFNGYKMVADLLDKPGPGKRAQSPSHLSLKFLVQVLQAVFCDVFPGHQQPLAILRESVRFVRYLVGVAVSKIIPLGVTISLWRWGERRDDSQQLMKLCSLGRVLYTQLINSSKEAVGRKEKGKSVPALCLEGVSHLLTTSISQCRCNLPIILARIASSSPLEEETCSEDIDEQIHLFIRQFQRLVVGVFDGSVTAFSQKEAGVMVSTITSLAGELSSNCTQLTQVLEWTASQCQEQTVDDVSLCKALVSLLLMVAQRTQGSAKITKKLAQDVHLHLGDLDAEVEMEGSGRFSVVTPHVASSALLGIMYDHLDDSLDSVDAALSFLKAELLALEDGMEENKKLFCSSCDSIIQLVGACSELVQTHLPVGPLTERLVKVLIKAMGTVNEMAKYQLSVFGRTFAVEPKFQKLVDAVALMLQKQIYSLITYIQEFKPEQRRKRGRKAAGKKPSSWNARVLREYRSFPNLIFAMESFEESVLKVAKKSKVNLTSKFHQTISRDFRILSSAIVADEEDEDEEDEDEKEDEQEGAPPKKLMK